MELHSTIKNINSLFELNNKFVKNYPFCDLLSNDYVTNGVKKFLGMFTKNGTTLLAAEYIFLGTYTKEKNIWIWADTSVTIDKSMKKEISSIRSKLIDAIVTLGNSQNNSLKLFVENDYTILHTDSIIETLSEMMSVLSDISKAVIITNGFRQMVDVMLIKRVIHDESTDDDINNDALE